MMKMINERNSLYVMGGTVNHFKKMTLALASAVMLSACGGDTVDEILPSDPNSNGSSQPSNGNSGGMTNGGSTNNGNQTPAPQISPSVAFDSPSNGAQFAAGQAFNVTVAANGDQPNEANSGVLSVSLYKNGQLVSADNTQPYSWSSSALNLNAGSHSLRAEAMIKNANTVSTNTIQIQITQAPVDNMPTADLSAGQSDYQSGCESCHGGQGKGTFPILPATKENTDNLDGLAAYIDEFMPTISGSPSDCVDECAVNVAAYILNGFSTSSSTGSGNANGGSSTPVDNGSGTNGGTGSSNSGNSGSGNSGSGNTGSSNSGSNSSGSSNSGSSNTGGSVSVGNAVSESVRKARVEAGHKAYTSKSCVICHGEDGRISVGGSSLHRCNACDSWDSLKNVIDVRMPPDNNAGFGPHSCAGDCAEAATDWIWNEVNGWPLTANGGARGSDGEDEFGFNTRRIKSYDAIRADFQRVFGFVPEILEESKGTFPAAPDYWYTVGDIGAVALNVVANAAVDACSKENFPSLMAANARQECSTWANDMWLREATNQEIDSCVDVAMSITSDVNSEKSRFVYACASMMMSMPALTY